MELSKRWISAALGVALCQAVMVARAGPSAGDIPARDAGEGPYARLVIRNVDVIDGTGAPAQGPYDVVIENDRIAEIRSIGAPGAIVAGKRVAAGDREIDGTGFTLLPGFVDTHVHLHGHGDSQGVAPEYVLKLWLAHGVTTARELGSSRPIEWMADVKRRSERNEIVAPRLDIYPFFNAIEPGINTPDAARKAVRSARKRGADGIKFIGAIPEDVLFAALDEAEEIGMRTTMHHSQQMVAYANVLKTAAHGLDSMEHWYGLPEAMFTDRRLQQWPVDFNNTDEQWRFAEAGRLWSQAAAPGSARWNEVMDQMLEHDFALSPTFVAYLASRDLMRMTNATWHDAYTLPALWDFYRPSRHHHGSYWFDWTLENEVDWRDNYRSWMQFVNAYKNRGGLVGVGSDSGYIYNLYGFGYVQEMELLREAGFSALEVLHAATGAGARILGHEDRAGTVRVGRKADLVLVRGNPVANLKLLYGTGTIRLNDQSDKVERIGGVDFTIKDGIVYDAARLREDVRRMVSQAKAAAGLPDAPMQVVDDEG